MEYRTNYWTRFDPPLNDGTEMVLLGSVAYPLIGDVKAMLTRERYSGKITVEKMTIINETLYDAEYVDGSMKW